MTVLLTDAVDNSSNTSLTGILGSFDFTKLGKTEKDLVDCGPDCFPDCLCNYDNCDCDLDCSCYVN